MAALSLAGRAADVVAFLQTDMRCVAGGEALI
ncbi:hypothetical protein T11_2024 [Trichinella zimbabwensis]|uniref:Uncharacterized protein n=1 Tax=Trichinella zimbabwensis TaxID=268475 RepID=A0A0V1GGL8_9BILA|nr:hypothetical protein T11_2024 [Trichinella zimbabwensis]